jgi:hypothetical protein
MNKADEVLADVRRLLYDNLGDGDAGKVCGMLSVVSRRIAEIEEENAKLVDVLHEVETEAVHAFHCLQQDCVTIANSTEHFFKKWWHAECELDRLKAENTKLRELAAWMYRLMDESCAVQHPYAPEPIRYDTLMDAHEKLRELGIEADS